MSNRSTLTRRGLLQVIGGVGASFVLGSFPSISCAATADAKTGTKKGPVFAPNAYVRIDPDGSVTIVVSKPDMGQGVRTSLAMLVADEMDADWSRVKVVQAPTDGRTYKQQGVGGSASIISMHEELRHIGAATRLMLVAAAAKQWNVDPSQCTTKSGKVISPDGKKSIEYGDLTAEAAAQPIPSTGVRLKTPAELNIVGKGATRVDNPDVVTGKAVYGLDAKVEGMAYAVVSRPPAPGASVKSFDDTAARKVPGVIDVQKFGKGVAVIGSHTWAAISGREALKIDWDMGPNTGVSSASIRKGLVAAVGEHKQLPSGAKTLTATFDFPYLAHATMEPMNAVADVKADSCTIWAPTQQPGSVQRSVANQLQLTQDKVTVNVTLLGGGFGRRLFGDYVTEAVNLSKQFKRPIKLTWTREDDMKNDHYRPMTHHDMKAVLDADGKPIGWSHQAVIAGGRDQGNWDDADINYGISNAGLRQASAPSPISTGPWRSVEHTYLSVANECFMDELAHAAGKDPFEYRRGLITDARLKNVLELAAKYAGWGTPLPAGSGRGIACFAGYGSYVAHVIELSVSGKEIKLHRAVAVVDCGLAVNPKGVEAQIQGALTDGLSTALRAEITIDKGAVVQSSWPDFRWMTLDAMPKVEVYIVPSHEGPGGMGEPGYPSGPPAVANAVFAATKKRVRKFPIRVEELV